jgi:cobaltochelatase CobS
MQLPGNSRALLRDAIRSFPQHDLAVETVTGSRATRVNSLTKDQLLNVAAILQIDVAAIVARDAATPKSVNTQAFENARASRDEDEDASQDDIRGAPQDAAQPADHQDVDVSTEASALRRELARAMVEGDFDTVTARITNLITDARKPAERITETVYVPAPAGTDPDLIKPRPVQAPQPLRAETWGSLFGVKGFQSSKKINVYPATHLTPTVDTKYRWPESVTCAALCAMGRGRNVWLYGPAGTGKTSFGEQLAARTGRPFTLIPCDDTTEAPELVGMTVPHQGGVRWQDGVLAAAMRIPHAIVLIDEPTVARPGAIMVLQSVLASGMLSVKETGEVIRCAEGVRFLVADNTNGTGGGTAEGYEGTRRMNRATLDRFASFLRVDYMAPRDEAAALVAHTGCTPMLAEILVECATLSRKARVTHALGLRRLIAWAEALTDGLDPRVAFEFAILNACARDDREPIEQACALGLDQKAVTLALKGQAAPRPAQAPVADFAG